MPVFEIDPQSDSRWAAFVASHPRSSIFHTPEWLQVLRRTYNFVPTAFTTCPSETPLTNGLVLCRVNSWLTGSKFISLPFSDHCEPLVDDSADLDVLLSEIRHKTTGQLKYAEIRPVSLDLREASGWMRYDRFYFHILDLSPALEELHSHLHKDSIQRKIRRSMREGLMLDQGRSDLLLRQFYDLLLRTRRRHGVPPQPLQWFRNLVDSLGPLLTIHVARLEGQPVASIITLRHRQTLVYKYGCSDERFHGAGAMPRLFWHAIEHAKSEQLLEMDLGRSDEGNAGLVRFKDRLGARKLPLTYWRFSVQGGGEGRVLRSLKSKWAQTALSHLPDPLFRLAGEIFYRHAS